MKYRYKLFLFTILWALSCQVLAQDITDELIAKYEFNGNADDTSGNGLHAFANATLATDRHGVANSCYFFNGVSGYIDFPNSPLLKPQLPVSISFWVNFSSLKPGLLTTDFAQNIHTGVWVSLNSKGNLAFNYGDAGSPNPTSRRTKIGETILQTGIWYHVLGVVRGATDMDIFINGINDCGTYSGTGGELVYSNLPGSIGRKDANPSLPPNYFYGYIDEFYYWNRVVGIEEIINTEITPLPTNFKSFEVPGQIELASIDTLNNTIDITIECNSSLTIVPTFDLSPNATAFIQNIQQFSGITVNNFIEMKVYTIKNSLGCTQFQSDWSVRIAKQIEPSSGVYLLTSFTNIGIQDQVGLPKIDTIQHLIEFEITCDASIGNLLLDFSIPNGTSASSNDSTFESGNPIDFSQPLLLNLSNNPTCTEQTWTISVVKNIFNKQDLFLKKTFFIPNVITPNQDNKNEYFKLGESLLGSSLIILNRQGIPVYQSENYQNDFSGYYLSSGVYYYAIKYDCYSELIKGTLTVLK